MSPEEFCSFPLKAQSGSGPSQAVIDRASEPLLRQQFCQDDIELQGIEAAHTGEKVAGGFRQASGGG